MANIPTIDVAAYFGPSFMLFCIALILFGAVCTQYYAYWSKRTEDSTMLRCCVLGVFLLETMHTATVLHFLYHYLIESAFDAVGIMHVIWTGGAIIVIAVLIIALVQGFYIHRIYQLSNGNLWAVSALSMSLLLRTAPAIAAGILIIRTGTWITVLNSGILRIVINFSLCMNAVTDAMLTAFFVYYLYKRRTGFDQTQHIVKTLIIYTLNTGALTIMGSLAVVIMFISSRSLLFAGMYAVVGKLYANSMLAQLNTRERVLPTFNENRCQVPLTGIRNEMNQRARGARAEIHVDVVKQTVTDPDEPPFSPKAPSDLGHRARDSFD